MNYNINTPVSYCLLTRSIMGIALSALLMSCTSIPTDPTRFGTLIAEIDSEEYIVRDLELASTNTFSRDRQRYIIAATLEDVGGARSRFVRTFVTDETFRNTSRFFDKRDPRIGIQPDIRFVDEALGAAWAGTHWVILGRQTFSGRNFFWLAGGIAPGSSTGRTIPAQTNPPQIIFEDQAGLVHRQVSVSGVRNVGRNQSNGSFVVAAVRRSEEMGRETAEILVLLIRRSATPVSPSTNEFSYQVLQELIIDEFPITDLNDADLTIVPDRVGNGGWTLIYERQGFMCATYFQEAQRGPDVIPGTPPGSVSVASDQSGGACGVPVANLLQQLVNREFAITAGDWFINRVVLYAVPTANNLPKAALQVAGQEQQGIVPQIGRYIVAFVETMPQGDNLKTIRFDANGIPPTGGLIVIRETNHGPTNVRNVSLSYDARTQSHWLLGEWSSANSMRILDPEIRTKWLGHTGTLVDEYFLNASPPWLTNSTFDVVNNKFTTVAMHDQPTYGIYARNDAHNDAFVNTRTINYGCDSSVNIVGPPGLPPYAGSEFYNIQLTNGPTTPAFGVVWLNVSPNLRTPASPCDLAVSMPSSLSGLDIFNEHKRMTATSNGSGTYPLSLPLHDLLPNHMFGRPTPQAATPLPLPTNRFLQWSWIVFEVDGSGRILPTTKTSPVLHLSIDR
ncbi:MAG: hypothetical protein AB2697_19010 [Candidatus Thiodiazotropha endolucinida]